MSLEKKRVYIFCIIVFIFLVILLAVQAFLYDILIIKIAFVIDLIALFIAVVGFIIERKSEKR